MKKEINLVEEFHKKFRVPVLNNPSLIPKDRSELRHRLMKEEVKEYLEGVGKKNIKEIAKELSDILYAVYGTILEYGLQDKIEEVFEEVHRSQMSKDYNEYKMVKGENYFEANLDKFFKE